MGHLVSSAVAGFADGVVGVALIAGLLLHGSAGLCQAQAPPAVQPALVPGAAAEFELGVGGSVRHLLVLGADTFVQVEMRELGPRTILSLLDPSGAVIARREPPADHVTSYRLLAVVPAAGAYTLEVRSYAQDGRGRHVIRLENPRPATERDRALASADAALAEAARLSSEGTAASRRQALAHLEAAETAFREEGDVRGQAFAALDRGLVLDAAADTSASAAFEPALALFASLGDEAAQAVAVNGLARARYREGDRRGALALHERAAALAQAAGDRRAQAHYIINAGVALDHSGRSEEAIDRFSRGLALATEAGSRRAEGRAVNNLGVAYQNLGDYRKALEYYERALTLQRAAGSGFGEIVVLGNISNIHHALKEYPEALAFFEQALPLARSAELPDQEAWLLKNVAKVHRALGDHARAVEAARRAVELSRASGEREGQGEALLSLGRSLHATGEEQSATEALREGLAVASRIGERFLEAEVLWALAEVERDVGRLRDAIEHAERCIELTEALRGAMTNPELRGSFQAAEEDKYGVLIDLQMRLHEEEPAAGHAAAALQTSERARGRLLLDALIEARADIRAGVDLVLLERERALQKQLSGAGAQADLETLKQQYGEVQALIRRHSPRYAALTQPAPASLDQIRSQVVDEDTVLLEFYLGTKRSFLWAVTPHDLVSQALPGRADLEAAARRVHGLLAGRQRSHAVAVARDADTRLAAEARALSLTLLGAVGPRLDGEWKGRRLLIVASGAVAYLPFGALPSPAGRPLVADHEIVYAPSASVSAALRVDPAQRPPGTTVAVLADPVFDAGDPRVVARSSSGKSRSGSRDSARPTRSQPSVGLTRALEAVGGSFPRLPFSRLEAREIARLVPRELLLSATDFEAARPLATQGSLQDRRIVHFATHGLLNTEHPELSGLVLSLVDRNGFAQDGFVRMQEIYNLNLPADLVVLSACQTALGREIRGEGLVGLARGFMYAGARAVVASLWQVDDESTAELMKRFYRGMLKENRRPADALRLAQIEMSRTKRWSAPFYWAGFVVQGEWR